MPIRINTVRFILLHLQFVDDTGTHQLGIGNRELLMPPAVLLVYLHHQLLSSGRVNLGRVNTVRSRLLPPTSVT